MTLDLTTEFLYINSDFLGLYANIPTYMLIGIPALVYAWRLMKREEEM